MPLALPGALTILLAQVAVAAKPVPEPAAPPVLRGSLVVQTEDGFIIASYPNLPQLPQPVTVTVGSAVNVDAELLASGICRTGSGRQ